MVYYEMPHSPVESTDLKGLSFKDWVKVSLGMANEQTTDAWASSNSSSIPDFMKVYAYIPMT